MIISCIKIVYASSPIMKSLVIVLLFAVGTFASVIPNPNLDAYWLEWKNSNAKEYDNKFAEMLRRSIWESNLKTIQKHNEDYSLGKTSFLMSMNEFGDLVNTPPFHEIGSWGSRIIWRSLDRLRTRDTVIRLIAGEGGGQTGA